jgi:hypothetical protein
MSLCPYIRASAPAHGKTRLPPEDFRESIFLKSVEKIQISLKSDKNNGYITRRPVCIYDSISLNSLEWQMFQTNVVEKITCSIIFSRKSLSFVRYKEIYGTARQATDDNITRRMRFSCWTVKATDAHSECVICLLPLPTPPPPHVNGGYENATLFYLMPTLSCFQNKQVLFTALIPDPSPHRPYFNIFCSVKIRNRVSLKYISYPYVRYMRFVDTLKLCRATHTMKSKMRDMEVLTAVLLKFEVFWDTKPFRLVIIYGCFDRF